VGVFPHVWVGSACLLLLLVCFIIRPWRWMRYISPKLQDSLLTTWR
jgi:hypothetical protein